MKLNDYFDHTHLKPDATESEIIRLCSEAIEYNFFSVCVNPCYIVLSKELLKDSSVKVCSVIGFPLGSSTTETKVFEAMDAIEKGADEIDMVVNISKLKESNFSYVLKEISMIKEACGPKILKVILETSLLNKEEIIKGTHIAIEAKADFVKTSTGFGSRGATLEDVSIMSFASEGKIAIKASGGIKSKRNAIDLIELGATRLGASASVAIVLDQHTNSNY